MARRTAAATSSGTGTEDRSSPAAGADALGVAAPAGAGGGVIVVGIIDTRPAESPAVFAGGVATLVCRDGNTSVSIADSTRADASAATSGSGATTLAGSVGAACGSAVSAPEFW